MAYKDIEKRRKYFREYYAAHRESRIAANSANKLRLLKHITKLKLATGCKICGYSTHAEALEYDHVSRDKLFEISKGVALGYSIPRLEKEIEKCELLCANCHRVRTAMRRVSSSGKSGSFVNY